MITEALDLKAMGVLTQEDILAETYARILLLGAMKTGKTTALLETAPSPLVINCDGEAATLFPARNGAKFIQLNATRGADSHV